MPEVKNNFLKSRMNKDLDSRILPNGEYRDARNLSISKSEGSDVGAIENIRGTINVTDFGLTDSGLEIIGIHNDIQKNRIFCFITNFSDSSGGENIGLHTNNFLGAKCYIAVYDDNSKSSNVIVSGRYLNFSKTHRILNVNIIEDLLFWTDNRNQPRKINIEKALEDNSYYDSEDLISVLKYNPYNAIKLAENLANPGFTDDYSSTIINETSQFLTPHLILPADNVSATDDFLAFNPTPGAHDTVSTAFNTDPNTSSNEEGFEKYLPSTMWNTNYTARPYNTSNIPKVLVKNTSKPNTGDFIIYSIQYSTLGYWTIGLSKVDTPDVRESSFPTTWEVGDKYSFSLENPYYNTSFRGDEDYLEDKFVRFSYRYKFEDGEYSLMAPFTQPAFLPKQYGSFLNGDKENTKESAIISFFENQLSTIGLNIELPDEYDNLYSNFNITGIDILLREAGNNNVYVVESVDKENFESYIGAPLTGSVTISSPIPVNNAGVDGTYRPLVVNNNNGKKLNISVTLVSGEITAITILSSGSGFKENDVFTIQSGELSQSSTSPSDPVNITVQSSFLKVARQDQFVYLYKSQKPTKVLEESEIVRVNDKAPIRALTQESSGNRIMYGNYIDRAPAPDKLNYSINIARKSNTGTSTLEYPTHNLKQNRTYQVGVVLSDRYGRSSNVILTDSIFNSTITGVKESSIFHRYLNSGIYNEGYWPGDSIRINFLDVIPEDNIYSSSNPTGWYTYKIVVKQQEQDYYNVYVPGALAGNIQWEPDNTLDWNTDEGLYKTRPNFTNTSTVSNIPLLGDNVNKIPRDLEKVGPEQSNYGSDEEIYCRVNPSQGSIRVNIYSTQTSTEDAIKKVEVDTIKPHRDLGDWAQTKGQYYPGQLEDNQSTSNLTVEPWYPFIWDSSSNTVPLEKDLIKWTDLFFNTNKGPYIATLSTEYKIGKTPSYSNLSGLTDLKRTVTSTYDSLSIFETTPFSSKLDILWETSTSGLISELNQNIRSSASGSAQNRLSTFSFILNEADAAGSDAIDSAFAAVDSTNTVVTDEFATMTLVEVLDASTPPINVTSKFRLNQDTPGAPGSSPLWKIVSAPGTTFAYLGSNENNRKFRFKFRSVVFNQAQDLYFPSLSNTYADLQNTRPFISGSSSLDIPYYGINKGLRVNLTNFWDNVNNSNVINNQGNINGDAIPKSFFPIIDFRDGTWKGLDSDEQNEGTSYTYQITNGSANTSLRESELKIVIDRIDYTTPNGFFGTGEDYFIVDSSGYRIISNPNNPPPYGYGKIAQNSPAKTFTQYYIYYRLVENWSGGLQSEWSYSIGNNNGAYILDIRMYNKNSQP